MNEVATAPVDTPQVPDVENPTQNGATAPVVEKTRKETIQECRKIVSHSLKALNTAFGEEYWKRLLDAEDIPSGYATQPAKVIQRLHDRLLETVIQPLVDKRMTKAEFNSKYVREHAEYEKAIKMAKLYGMPVTEEDGYPFGKLPEQAEALVRENIGKLPYTGDGNVPVEEVNLSFTLTEGAVSPQGRKARESTNGAKATSGNDTIRDLLLNKTTTPGYEVMWDAYSVAHEPMLRATLQKHREDWERDGGSVSKLPGQVFNGKVCAAVLLRMAMEDGTIPKNQITKLLREWAVKQVHNGKPRFEIKTADGSFRPYDSI